MGAEKTRMREAKRDANRDSSLNICIRLVANVVILEAVVVELSTQSILQVNDR